MTIDLDIRCHQSGGPAIIINPQTMEIFAKGYVRFGEITFDGESEPCTDDMSMIPMALDVDDQEMEILMKKLDRMGLKLENEGDVCMNVHIMSDDVEIEGIDSDCQPRK